jgi:hypothetical protein
VAVAFRQTASASATTVSSIAVNVPSGTVDGDIMVAVIMAAAASHTITCTGWTVLDAQTSSGPSTATLYRVAAGEPASYTFSWTGGSSANVSGMISSYSGGKISNPIDTHVAWHRTASTVTVTCDPITTGVNSCLVVAVCTVNLSSTFSGPAGYTQNAVLSNASGSIMMADKTFALTAGSGTLTSTVTSGTTEGTIVSIAPSTTVQVPTHLMLGV